MTTNSPSSWDIPKAPAIAFALTGAFGVGLGFLLADHPGSPFAWLAFGLAALGVLGVHRIFLRAWISRFIAPRYSLVADITVGILAAGLVLGPLAGAAHFPVPSQVGTGVVLTGAVLWLAILGAGLLFSLRSTWHWARSRKARR